MTIPTRRRGFIARLVRDKYFGFIRTPDAQEYFFHAKDLKNSHNDYDLLVEKRTEVEFQPGEDRGRGPRAELVTIIK